MHCGNDYREMPSRMEDYFPNGPLGPCTDCPDSSEEDYFGNFPMGPDPRLRRTAHCPD